MTIEMSDRGEQAVQRAYQPTPLPAGWYPDAYGVVRFWDGQGWTQNVAPPQQVQYAAGPQVVVQAPYRMVTTSKRHTSHGLHLFLTIITGGVWGLFVWLPLTLINMLNKEKSVTRVGY
jgi:hypothetical protein